MEPANVALLSLAVLLGIGVLASYYLIYNDYAQNKGHDYWVGIPPECQYMFYAFWILAALGFIWYILNQVIYPTDDDAGLFSHGEWIRPTIVAIILICSILWSVCVWGNFHKGYSKAWTSLTLIVVAIGTILLLAGEAEANAPWHRILALLFFAVNVVLIDAVMWNAKFILFDFTPKSG
jgi:hypothetical protein